MTQGHVVPEHEPPWWHSSISIAFVLVIATVCATWILDVIGVAS